MSEEKQIKCYLKKEHRTATVANGDFARQFKKEEEPFEVGETAWNDHVKPTGMFQTTKPKGSGEAPGSGEQTATEKEA